LADGLDIVFIKISRTLDVGTEYLSRHDLQMIKEFLRITLTVLSPQILGQTLNSTDETTPKASVSSGMIPSGIEDGSLNQLCADNL